MQTTIIRVVLLSPLLWSAMAKKISQWLILAIGAVLVLAEGEVFSQCCTANPIAGAANIGVLTKNTLRILVFHRYNFTDVYYKGSEPSDFDFVKKADYNYSSEIFSFGLTERLTLENEMGYYWNRSETFNTQPVITINGYGLSNGVISVKYAFTKENEFEITAGAGIKYPFRKEPLSKDGVELPQTVQPSTGALGAAAKLFLQKVFNEKRIRLFLIHRTDVNGVNSVGYRNGNNFSTSFIFSKSFSIRWTSLFQLRNEIRGRDWRDGNAYTNSGGTLFFLSPQLNFALTQKWNFSLMGDFPFYQYYNGTQQANRYAVVATMIKDFNIGK